MQFHRKPSKPALLVLEKLDQLLTDSRWESSLFLRAIKKKIELVRSQYTEEIGYEASLEQALNTPIELTLPPDMAEVYIALYNTEGSNLKKWEALLAAISIQGISRPIYQSEQDIQEFIRSKDYQQNDAYAVLWIRKEHIYQPYNKPPVDKSGRPLLVVKEGMIKPQSIARFVHVTGRYRFLDGKLVHI